MSIQVHGQIQARLASEGRQQRIGPFPLDHLRQDFPSERFDIGPIRRVGVGHDGGRVGIDQDHLVVLFAEGLAGLRPGIVEFTGLANDDRPRPNQQYFVEIVTSWHGEAVLNRQWGQWERYKIPPS